MKRKFEKSDLKVSLKRAVRGSNLIYETEIRLLMEFRLFSSNCNQLTAQTMKNTQPRSYVYIVLCPFPFGILKSGRTYPTFLFFVIKARTPDNNKMKSVGSVKVAVETIKIPSTLQLHLQVSKVHE